jgi:transposase
MQLLELQEHTLHGVFLVECGQFHASSHGGSYQHGEEEHEYCYPDTLLLMIHEWKDRKQKGSEPRLTKDQKERLKITIDSGSQKYGFDTDLWTLKRIESVIEKEFNVHYSLSQVWYILRDPGYSAQIPVAVAMEKNPHYVKEWIEKDYPEHVKEAREHNAVILFSMNRECRSPREKDMVRKGKESKDHRQGEKG